MDLAHFADRGRAQSGIRSMSFLSSRPIAPSRSRRGRRICAFTAILCHADGDRTGVLAVRLPVERRLSASRIRSSFPVCPESRSGAHLRRGSAGPGGVRSPTPPGLFHTHIHMHGEWWTKPRSMFRSRRASTASNGRGTAHRRHARAAGQPPLPQPKAGRVSSDSTISERSDVVATMARIGGYVGEIGQAAAFLLRAADDFLRIGMYVCRKRAAARVGKSRRWWKTASCSCRWRWS